MDKKQRHNLLLVLAVIILLIGVIVQLYLMVAPEQKAEIQNSSQSTTQPE
jgi:hypothetical protein